MITNLFLCLIFTSLLLINNQHSVNSEVIPPRATAVKGELVCGNVSVADAVVQLFRINSDGKPEKCQNITMKQAENNSVRK